MSEARPAPRPGARPGPPESRPALVTILAGVFLLFAAFGAAGAVLALSRGGTSGEERVFAVLSSLLAALIGTGAFGLLRKVSWARGLLTTTGVLVLSMSAFGAFRRVSAAAAPAAALAPSEPDAANSLALFRAGSAIAFLISAIPLVVALSLLRHPTVRDWANPEERGSARRRKPDALLVAVGGALAVAALAFFLSKKSSSPGVQVPRVALAPAETFLWSDRPITFAVPPEPFTRERHAEGGSKGVSFTRYQAPPTRMTISEAFFDAAPNTIEEVLAKKRLTNASFPSADFVEVGEPVSAAVGGAPAFQTDYTMRERSMQHVGRGSSSSPAATSSSSRFSAARRTSARSRRSSRRSRSPRPAARRARSGRPAGRTCPRRTRARPRSAWASTASS